MKTAITVFAVLLLQVALFLAWYGGFREGWRQSETTCHQPTNSRSSGRAYLGASLEASPGASHHPAAGSTDPSA